MQSLLKDFGIDVRICIKSDATAAIGMARRQGLGRVRHLATSDLWIQQRLRAGDFTILKHPGTENSADLMTKVKGRADISKFLGLMGFIMGKGRSEIAPKRHKWTVDRPVPSPGKDDVLSELQSIDQSPCVDEQLCVSHLLEGYSLHSDRPLPPIEGRQLLYVFDVAQGEVVFDARSCPTGPTSEPDLHMLTTTGVRPQWLVTWRVDQ